MSSSTNSNIIITHKLYYVIKISKILTDLVILKIKWIKMRVSNMHYVYISLTVDVILSDPPFLNKMSDLQHHPFNLILTK